MPHPISTMLELNSTELDLLMVQGWIEYARETAPTNQTVQRELDRHQIEIEEKLATIALTRFIISSQN